MKPVTFPGYVAIQDVYEQLEIEPVDTQEAKNVGHAVMVIYYNETGEMPKSDRRKQPAWHTNPAGTHKCNVYPAWYFDIIHTQIDLHESLKAQQICMDFEWKQTKP